MQNELYPLKIYKKSYKDSLKIVNFVEYFLYA